MTISLHTLWGIIYDNQSTHLTVPTPRGIEINESSFFPEDFIIEVSRSEDDNVGRSNFKLFISADFFVDPTNRIESLWRIG